MKRIFSTMLVAVLFLSSCQQKPVEVKQVDPDAEKGKISELMDKYNSALIGKDIDQVSALLSDDLLFLGTDPSEFWNKEAIIGLWKHDFADTAFALNYTVDKREIKLASDGNSAIVVEQYTVALISHIIPVRFVGHLINSESGWMIDFASVALIPKNEELAPINMALEK